MPNGKRTREGYRQLLGFAHCGQRHDENKSCHDPAHVASYEWNAPNGDVSALGSFSMACLIPMCDARITRGELSKRRSSESASVPASGDPRHNGPMFLSWHSYHGLPIAFLLQNTQNRDTRALQLKLDELIRSTAGARSQLIQLEELDDDQLDALKHEFERLHERRSRTSG